MKHETAVFTCGHTAVLKPNLFGRGQARQQRITEYFNRTCLQCAVGAVRPYYASLSMSKDGTKFHGQFLDEKVKDKCAKLTSTYLMTENWV